MSEKPSSSPESLELPDNLYDLKKMWSNLNVSQRALLLGRIYSAQHTETNGKNDFIMRAVRILGADITVIKMLVDTYEHTGEYSLRKIVSGEHDEIAEVPDNKPKKSGKKKIDLGADCETKKRKTLLTNSLHVQLSADEAAELYKDLKADWNNWPVLKRAVELRRLFQFEGIRLNGDETQAYARLKSKIRFLSNKEITGYLELSSQPTGLKSVANREILGEEAVELIGEMRLEFGNLFDSKRLGSEIGKVAGNKENFDEKGLLKIEAIETVCSQLQEIQDRLSDLRLGETYVINLADSTFKKEYEGISDEKFELVPPNDPVYTECHRNQNPPAEKVLCRNKELRNRVVFIDCRALCRPSDLKKDDY